MPYNASDLMIYFKFGQPRMVGVIRKIAKSKVDFHVQTICIHGNPTPANPDKYMYKAS